MSEDISSAKISSATSEMHGMEIQPSVIADPATFLEPADRAALNRAVVAIQRSLHSKLGGA